MSSNSVNSPSTFGTGSDLGASMMIPREALFASDDLLKKNMANFQTMKLNSDESNAGKVERVVVSKGQLIVAGSQKVAEFSKKKAEFFTFEKALYDKPCHSIFVHQDLLLMQEWNSNNMIVYNTMKQKIETILEGKSAPDKDPKEGKGFRVKQSLLSDSGELLYVLWYKGDGLVVAIDYKKDPDPTTWGKLPNLPFFDVGGGVAAKEGDPVTIVPISLIFKSSPAKILGLYSCNKEFLIKTCEIEKSKARYFNITKKPILERGEDSSGDQGKTIETVMEPYVIEESIRKNIFFLASKNKLGGTQTNPDRGKISNQISMIKFGTKGLVLMNYFTFEPSKHPEVKSITCVKNYPYTTSGDKIDILLIGCDQSIIILKMTKSEVFQEFHKFKMVANSSVEDLEWSNISIFISAKDSKEVSILTFNNNFNLAEAVFDLDFKEYSTNKCDIPKQGNSLLTPQAR